MTYLFYRNSERIKTCQILKYVWEECSSPQRLHEAWTINPEEQPHLKKAQT